MQSANHVLYDSSRPDPSWKQPSARHHLQLVWTIPGDRRHQMIEAGLAPLCWWLRPISDQNLITTKNIRKRPQTFGVHYTSISDLLNTLNICISCHPPPQKKKKKLLETSNSINPQTLLFKLNSPCPALWHLPRPSPTVGRCSPRCGQCWERRAAGHPRGPNRLADHCRQSGAWQVDG